ncbi:hypothetical protein BV22DRAFT_350321 [Leucogyrophana mollusca]|uniref:Uncharacterized protein n=1 Tax=Leucogyrophana mollusca TaxID=85980 RepID=A0ACB8BMR7_9AGAM|nr:hypothetical protein BV22DRAFT_350321 [Leucogyrophana mollusca]
MSSMTRASSVSGGYLQVFVRRYTTAPYSSCAGKRGVSVLHRSNCKLSPTSEIFAFGALILQAALSGLYSLHCNVSSPLRCARTLLAMYSHSVRYQLLMVVR